MRLRKPQGLRDVAPDTLRKTDADVPLIGRSILRDSAVEPVRSCERCGKRPAELLVVEEPEGMAVWICSYCRESGGFSRILARRGRRYRL